MTVLNKDIGARAKFLELNPDRIKLGLKTNKKMAAHLGVSEGSIFNWGKELKKPSEFNLREAWEQEEETIWNSFMEKVKEGKINSAALKTLAQLADKLVEKKEESVKIDFTPTDRIRIAQDVIEGLKLQSNGGRCPICGKSSIFLDDPCLFTGREQQEESPVATVELPT